jgi:hypothetical protein
MTYTLPEIKGFTDSTYGNDCCPSLFYKIDNDFGLQLFCDSEDQSESEHADLDPNDYFIYTLVLTDTPITLLRSNDLNEVKSFIDALMKTNFWGDYK